MDTTLSWSNVELFMPDLDGRESRIPFEIGADTLFEMSKPGKSLPVSRIGRLIRDARKKSGLTQQQLATRSRTTRNYISRIENDRSGIELDTLQKIIEIGLGKKMVLYCLVVSRRSAVSGFTIQRFLGAAISCMNKCFGYLFVQQLFDFLIMSL